VTRHPPPTRHYQTAKTTAKITTHYSHTHFADVFAYHPPTPPRPPHRIKDTGSAKTRGWFLTTSDILVFEASQQRRSAWNESRQPQRPLRCNKKMQKHHQRCRNVLRRFLATLTTDQASLCARIRRRPPSGSPIGLPAKIQAATTGLGHGGRYTSAARVFFASRRWARGNMREDSWLRFRMRRVGHWNEAHEGGRLLTQTNHKMTLQKQ